MRIRVHVFAYPLMLWTMLEGMAKCRVAAMDRDFHL